jgi:lactoylglutathione lyase
MLTVQRIAHVALKVTDIERTLDFYINKLGFDELMRLDRDGQLWLVYLRVTDDQFIEIFPDGEGERAPNERAVGYHHLCLAVQDIDRAIDELSQVGIPLLYGQKLGADGNRQCWIQDPDGHRIEIMQMMPDGLQTVAINKRNNQTTD